MAETKTKTTAVSEAEKEEIYIPRGQVNDDSMFFVSVNGVNYLLPKGETSKVPKEIANEVRRALGAMEEFEKMQAKLASAAADLN